MANEDKIPDSTGNEISVSTEGNDQFPKARRNCILYACFATMMRHKNRDRFTKLCAISDYD